MNPLTHLSLADLLREVRTAERLAVAIPPRPLEEAAVNRGYLEALHAERVAELHRRTALVEQARSSRERHG
jgi:hypothetical protein